MAGTILDAADLLNISGPSWSFWRMVLAVLFGLPLTPEQQALALRHSGRTQPFTRPLRECWLCVGRRGGKSRVLALVAIFLSCFCDYSDILAPGESGVVLIVAPTQRQARVLLNYCGGFLRSIPMLAAMIVRQTDSAIELNNNIIVEVRSNDYRTIRGSTVVGGLGDECAFLPQDLSAIPDTELLNALRPALATVRNSKLILSSTPYSQRGELYRAYRSHFGNDDSDVAFFNADTMTANPSMDPQIIEAAFVDDVAVAGAEYGCDGFTRFRSDVERLFSEEMLDAATDHDRPLILPPCFTEETA